jgi:hypothetical protein
VSKSRQNGEVRAIIGSGYLAGDKDLRNAGPIPKSAGVKVVSKTSAKGTKNEAAKRTSK